MTTARQIISDALTFGLNRLSPGETLDADLANTCLSALNSIADEMNGSRTFLFREILTESGPITGEFGTIGVDWVGLSPSIEILGATVAYSAVLDVPMDPLTMGQYQSIAIKSLTTYPAYYCPDGASLVYLYPAAAAHVITLRTRQLVDDFADLDTVYALPNGYRAYLAALLAEKVANVVLGGLPAPVAVAAKAARRSLTAQGFTPAIINGGDMAGPVARIRRGY